MITRTIRAAVAVALTIAVSAVFPTYAATTITESVTLTEDTDWTEFGTVTLAAGATVTVKVNLDDEKFRTLALSKDAETGKYNGKLLSFGGARPAGTVFVPDAASANRCKFIEDENGDIILEFLKGFTLYIR